MKNEQQITEFTTLLLTTGDADTSYRSKIPTDAIASITPLVQAGGGVLFSTRLAGMQLIVREGGPPGCAITDFRGPEDQPCVLCGLVWDEAQAESVWDFLLEEARESGRIAAMLKQPTVPWMGVVAYPIVQEFTEREISMLGMVERMVAFAILNEAGR